MHETITFLLATSKKKLKSVNIWLLVPCVPPVHTPNGSWSGPDVSRETRDQQTHRQTDKATCVAICHIATAMRPNNGDNINTCAVIGPE